MALSGLTNLFETPDLPSLSVSKLNDKGFILSDDLVIPGGVVFLGGRALLWDVDPPADPATSGKGVEGSWDGWEVERFKVFEVVVPRPGMSLLEIYMALPATWVTASQRPPSGVQSSLILDLDAVRCRGGEGVRYGMILKASRRHRQSTDLRLTRQRSCCWVPVNESSPLPSGYETTSLPSEYS